jgi:hypothetical protein
MTEKPKTSRLHRLFDALSQALNVLVFNGEANNSISGDAYRLGRKRLERFIDGLFSRFEDNHCLKSYLNDVDAARRLLEDAGRRGQ